MDVVNDSTGEKPLDSRVGQWIDSGIPIGDAIRIALGGSLPKFATRHELNRTNTASQVYGHRRPTDDVVRAIQKELGGSEDEIRKLLWLAAEPVAAAS